MTINEENRLTIQIEELKQKDYQNNYRIDKKINEKDQQVVNVKGDMNILLLIVDIFHTIQKDYKTMIREHSIKILDVYRQIQESCKHRAKNRNFITNKIYSMEEIITMTRRTKN